MIFSPNIYQPKLCALDFSVDGTKVHGYTKFTRNESIHVQLSFDDGIRENVYIDNTRLLLNVMKCCGQVVYIEPMTITSVERDNSGKRYAHCFARIPRFFDLGIEDAGMYKIQVTWRDRNETNANSEVDFMWNKLVSDTYVLNASILVEQDEMPNYSFNIRTLTNGAVGDTALSIIRRHIMANSNNTINRVTIYNNNNGKSVTSELVEMKGTATNTNDLWYFSVIRNNLISDNYTYRTGQYIDANRRRLNYWSYLNSASWNFEHTIFSNVYTYTPHKEVYDPQRVLAESEIFEIIPHPQRTILINFQHFKNLLGCQFGDYTNYMFRVDGRFMRERPEFSAPSEEFTTYDNRNIKLSGFPINTFTLTFGELRGLPRETVMKILLAMQCKSLIINGIPCKLVGGQDELDAVAQYMNGNTIFNLKFQPAENKYISGYENTGLVAGGQFPIDEWEKEPPIPEDYT